MGKKRKELSHDEVWDDSGLIKSWNASLEEYKLYHSIYLRGGSLQDVLAAAEADDAMNTTSELNEGGGAKDTANMNEEVDADSRMGDEREQGPATRRRENQDETSVKQDTRADGPTEEAAGTMPAMQGSISGRLAEQSSSDGPLKNLMMSWYWAGYYSGYYEGQRAAFVPRGTNQQEDHAA